MILADRENRGDALKLVPEAGFEPARPIRPADFKGIPQLPLNQFLARFLSATRREIARAFPRRSGTLADS